MTQTTKRRSSIFPFLQIDGALSRVRSSGKTEGAAPAGLLAAASEKQAVCAVITARGQRFSIRQIGSIFGSE